MHGQTDVQWTDYGTKLIYPFSKEKSVYNTKFFGHDVAQHGHAFYHKMFLIYIFTIK